MKLNSRTLHANWRSIPVGVMAWLLAAQLMTSERFRFSDAVETADMVTFSSSPLNMASPDTRV